MDPDGLLEQTVVPEETCPAPVVFTVHPELVTVAEENAYIMEDVLASRPVFLPPTVEQVPGEGADRPPECGQINWVLPPCMHDPKGDYNDHIGRLQLKMKIPGSEWDTGALQRMQKLEMQPLTVPYLTVTEDIRVAAEAVAPRMTVEEQELGNQANELGIPDDPAGMDAYMVDMQRRCLGGPYTEDTVRSLRDTCIVYLDRPAGMPETMAGQSRSVSVTRRHEQTISTEAQSFLDTPITDHLVRFVYEGATDSDPLAGAEDEL